MPSGYLHLIAQPHAAYEEGDVLGACNYLKIRCMAGWRICGERQRRGRQYAGLNSHGYLPAVHLLKDWHEAISECRYERLNHTQAKLIRLSDMRELVVTTGVAYTNFRGQDERYHHVEQFCHGQIRTFRKESAQGKSIFSEDGDVNTIILYYGRTDSSDDNMDTIWTAIVSKTGRLEADETTYAKEPPFGSYKRGRVVIRVDDFTNEERGELTASLIDDTDPDNPVTLKKRKSWVDWQNDLGLTGREITDVKDDRQDPDLRTEEKVRSSIVRTKTA